MPEVRAGAARLPAVGPRRDRPGEARPGVPVLADAELREGRHLPARPAAVRRPQLPGEPRDAREASRSPTASRRSRRARTRRGRRTGCTPTPTTPSSSTRLTEAIEAADPRDRRLTARDGRPRVRAAPRDPATRALDGRAASRSSALLLVVCFLSITMGSRVDHARDDLEGVHRLRPELGVARRSSARCASRARCSASRSGAALGLSGAILQGVTRNPLADPGIMGINAGAAAFVVVRGHGARRAGADALRSGSAFLGAGARDRRGLRRRLVRPRGRDAGEARARRRGGHRRR